MQLHRSLYYAVGAFVMVLGAWVMLMTPIIMRTLVTFYLALWDDVLRRNVGVAPPAGESSTKKSPSPTTSASRPGAVEQSLDPHPRREAGEQHDSSGSGTGEQTRTGVEDNIRIPRVSSSSSFVASSSPPVGFVAASSSPVTPKHFRQLFQFEDIIFLTIRRLENHLTGYVNFFALILFENVFLLSFGLLLTVRDTSYHDDDIIARTKYFRDQGLRQFAFLFPFMWWWYVQFLTHGASVYESFRDARLLSPVLGNKILSLVDFFLGSRKLV